jgi:hypothetical protein
MDMAGGGWNVKNQNSEESEHQKFFLNNQNIESQKDQNIKSMIRMPKIRTSKRTSKVREIRLSMF